MNVIESFEEIKVIIGEAIKEERESLRLKRKKLAEMLRDKYVWRKMDDKLLEDIESNKHRLIFAELKLICSALDCSMAQIIKRAYEKIGEMAH